MSQLFFKIMKPAKTFFGVDYSDKKQKQGVAQMVHFENFGYLQERSQISKKDFVKYLNTYSSMNKRIVNKQFHAVLSCEGTRYSIEKLKDYAVEIMAKMGYGENPILIYGHTDTKNNHVHIVTSRVGPDGQKIDHNFEGIRANEIVANLLNLDVGAVFTKSLEESLAFSFPSIAAFMLLMERRGYTCQVNDSGEIEFFKHGHKQGQISQDALKPIIAVYGQGGGRVEQIRAFLFDNVGRYSPTLSVGRPGTDPKAKAQFRSPLTDYLRAVHGLDFVFFAGPGKNEPYGFSVIDYNNKVVYKGQDIIRWSVLIDAREQKAMTPASKMNRPPAGGPSFEDIEKGRGSARPRDRAPKSPGIAPEEAIALQSLNDQNDSGLYYFDQMVNDALRENDRAARRTSKRKKKKKRGIS